MNKLFERAVRIERKKVMTVAVWTGAICRNVHGFLVKKSAVSATTVTVVAKNEIKNVTETKRKLIIIRK